MVVPHDAIPPNPFSGGPWDDRSTGDHSGALPPDPFAGDPDDPAKALLDDATDDEAGPPMSEQEREELLADLSDLAVYQALLEPRGVRGIVVDCGECQEPHYHDWALLAASLEQLLNDGKMRPHEPAFDPDPASYVSWEYCRGYADGVTASENAL
ncbi:hypothetical protein Aglo01_09070 [Actinokineospora globicatena]|uniref:DUF5319 domain-containing protein n=1 Tax=Actinokineospora globicatena TaxID=103729 RepID=A0A9W6VCA4_9PSEU|nr:hypothetical protein Aglo01_09070 [Actinokineospora globicatena]GLW83260.1 hypothetical protein Aglo02_09000 [Actinokineospora globicatena]GLW94759.1 hypothetical protein Aglo03_55750 [Actinokineospora globicatena]